MCSNVVDRKVYVVIVTELTNIPKAINSRAGAGLDQPERVVYITVRRNATVVYNLVVDPETVKKEECGRSRCRWESKFPSRSVQGNKALELHR